MNKVILIGNLTRDPEIRYSQAAEPIAICKFTIAVNKRFKREGEPDADFIHCVALGRTGEFIEKYFSKGRKIAITGRLNVRQFDDANGVRKVWTEVVVEESHFVDSKPSADRVSSGGPDNDDYYADMAQTKPFNTGRQSFGASESAPAPVSASPAFAAVDESLDDEELPF